MSSYFNKLYFKVKGKLKVVLHLFNGDCDVVLNFIYSHTDIKLVLFLGYTK